MSKWFLVLCLIYQLDNQVFAQTFPALFSPFIYLLRSSTKEFLNPILVEMIMSSYQSSLILAQSLPAGIVTAACSEMPAPLPS